MTDPGFMALSIIYAAQVIEQSLCVSCNAATKTNSLDRQGWMQGGDVYSHTRVFRTVISVVICVAKYPGGKSQQPTAGFIGSC